MARLITRMGCLTTLGLAALLVISVWLVRSDNSPFNRCEATDTVRIHLGGREYHIPVELQPSIWRRGSDDFPRRFGYVDHTGVDVGRGTWLYCQGPDDPAESYEFLTINNDRVFPGAWESVASLGYVPKLTYLSFDTVSVPFPKPFFQRLGTASGGLYWLHGDPVEEPRRRFELYSRNWTHEGEAVKGRRTVGQFGTTGYRILAQLNRGGRVWIDASDSHPVAPEDEHIRLSIPPEEWPAMLQEITELMKSLEAKNPKDIGQ